MKLVKNVLHHVLGFDSTLNVMLHVDFKPRKVHIVNKTESKYYKVSENE